MPQALELCVQKVTQEQIKKGKSEKTAKASAWAICQASQKESARWFKDGETFLYVDPDTFQIDTVSEGEIPTTATVYDLREVERTAPKEEPPAPPEKLPDAPPEKLPEDKPVEVPEAKPADKPVGEAAHSHEHQHPDMKAHTHAHPHSGEVILDKKHLKEDHAKHDHAEGDEPEAMDTDAEENQESQMPMAMQAGAKKESRTLVFGEQVSLKESIVDKIKKTVEVTLIKPGWSLNGRYYGRETLAKAVPVFEGTKAFLDHPSMDEEKNRPERSVADITGYYTGVKQADDGSLKAVRHFVGRGERDIWPLVLEAVANKPDLIGLSINALGHTEMGEAEGRKGVIVAELVKSFSVDDVTVASAGGKYDRLMQSGDEMTQALLQNATYEEWRSANPDFEARIKKEMRTARKEELESDALKEVVQLKDRASLLEKESLDKETTAQALKEQVASLQTQLADQERESALRVSEALADYKLLASKLPKEWLSKEALKGKTEAEMDTLIEAEKVKYFSVQEPVVVTNSGTPGVPEIDPGVISVLEALKVSSTIVPLDDESPEEYAKRKSTRS